VYVYFDVIQANVYYNLVLLNSEYSNAHVRWKYLPSTKQRATRRREKSASSLGQRLIVAICFLNKNVELPAGAKKAPLELCPTLNRCKIFF
jgi:hypothetical protein